MARVKAVAAKAGGKVNDVVLALAGGRLRHYLYSRKTGAGAAAANAWLDDLAANKRYHLDVSGST